MCDVPQARGAAPGFNVPGSFLGVLLPLAFQGSPECGLGMGQSSTGQGTRTPRAPRPQLTWGHSLPLCRTALCMPGPALCPPGHTRPPCPPPLSPTRLNFCMSPLWSCPDCSHLPLCSMALCTGLRAGAQDHAVGTTSRRAQGWAACSCYTLHTRALGGGTGGSARCR